MDAWQRAHDGATLDRAVAEDLALELFVAGYDGLSLPTDYATLIERGLTGVVLFRRNFDYASGEVDIDQVCAHTAQVAAAAARGPSPLPPVVSVDQEGGAVARLKAPFTVLPPMRALGDRGDLDLIRAVGGQLGRELGAAGFNVDYAPVIDVDTNPANPIIGDRSFARDPALVARCAAALLAGLHDHGVTGCGKHFPGHGDTDVDSHLDLPVIGHDRARLDAVELLPFRALAAELRLVMTAHVLFPALDPRWPATLSPQILGPLLRVSCQYAGVIVSDDLEMQGIAKVLDSGACVRRGLAAGVDLFLVCRRRDTLDAAWQAASEVLAAAPGDPLRARALDAVARVRVMRQRLSHPRPDPARARAVFEDADTARLRASLAAGTLG